MIVAPFPCPVLFRLAHKQLNSTANWVTKFALNIAKSETETAPSSLLCIIFFIHLAITKIGAKTAASYTTTNQISKIMINSTTLSVVHKYEICQKYIKAEVKNFIKFQEHCKK